MIFFFNANGDLLKGNPDTVYQGSSNAGKIYAVAPLNPGLIADIYFTLPNGDEAGPYLLTNGGTVIEGKELPDGYALWFINLNSNLTQFAGDLTAQIGFYATEDMTAETADGVAQKVPVITTQAFNITIARGVARTLPAEPTNDVYEQIVNTLTVLSGDLTKLTEDVKNLSSTYPPASIKDIGEAEVTYNTDDGVVLKATEQWVCENGKTFDIDTEREFPIRGGNGIIIDVPEGNPPFVEVKLETTPIPASEKGEANGVATLDSSGLIPTSQLPTYVDDVIDSYIVGETLFASDWLSRTPGGAPLTPERDKIYVICSEGTFINTEYRWSGTVYAALGKSTPLSNTTGQSTEVGMTQKAITDELNKKQNSIFVYTVNTSEEITVSAEDLEKLKNDDNAIIVVTESGTSRYYHKMSRCDSTGYNKSDRFVCVTDPTPTGTTGQITFVFYRELDYDDAKLRKTVVIELAEYSDIENKLSKPADNPTEDSLVKVSSAGTSSWKPVSDFLDAKLDDLKTVDGYVTFLKQITVGGRVNTDYVYITPDKGYSPYSDVRDPNSNFGKYFHLTKNYGTPLTKNAELYLPEKSGTFALQEDTIANPTLDGTEADLTGLEVNGTKYKVPSGGGSGAGIDTLTDVNLTSSGTTVAYDIASGVTVNSNGKFTYEGGEKEATTEVNVPIVAGKGIVIDKVADKEQVEVKVDINDAVKYAQNGTTYNRTICIGDESLSLGTQYAVDIVAIGTRAGAFEFSNAIGAESKARGTASNAIGYYAKSSGNNSIAIGFRAESIGNNSIAIGNGAKTNNERNIAIGNGAICRNKIVTAIGGGTYLDGTNDLIVFGAGIPGISKNAFKIDTDYNAYAGDAAQRRLAFVNEVKPTDNPTEDSVVKISSTGGVSYEPLSSLGGGGSVAVEITSPATATSGTLTADQLSTLQASNDNYIIFNDEIYRLADKEHTTGILSYTHTGWNGSAMQDKSINITVSTLAWTLVMGQNALIKPEGNPEQDSVVKVSLTGASSWKPLSDFLAKDTTETPYDQVYFKNTDGSNIMRNVRSVPNAYVMPIYNGNGQIKTNAPTEDLDCVNLKYFKGNAAQYRHIITLQGLTGDYAGEFSFVFYSHSNLNCDSLTDLKTLLGDSFNIPCCGDGSVVTSGSTHGVIATSISSQYGISVFYYNGSDLQTINIPWTNIGVIADNSIKV